MRGSMIRLMRLASEFGLLIGLAFSAAAGTPRASLFDGDSPSVQRLSPANGATEVCVDTALSITFDRAPRIGTAGTISLYRSDGSLADSINLADPHSSKRSIGGAQFGKVPYLWNYHPILVTNHSATIYLHQALDYGQTYYVTMTRGVITDAAGQEYPGISDPSTWRFATKSSRPAAETTRLTVAANGIGDFCTVQGAIDFVPQNNTQRVFITVRKGTYSEIIYVRANKPLITMCGEDRERTIIQYDNNNKYNPGNFRVMFGVDAPDFTIANITLHNTTPHRGSQAEAFRSGSQRVVLDRVNLKSFQDTLFIQGRAFVNNSKIEGDVDFMWGSGIVFFKNCELEMVNSKGYYTQVRNSRGVPGYVYVNCRLTCANEGITGCYLSRIDPNVYPNSQVVFLNTMMGPHIRPEGWLLNNATEAPRVQFWEFQSSDLNGKPLDVNHRAPFSRQLTAEEAQQWSDPAFVLRGWVPDLKSLLPPDDK